MIPEKINEIIQRKSLVIVILFAILTRLIYFIAALISSYNQLGVKIFIVDESNSYLNFAKNLLICHMMAATPCLPSAFRTPIYPFFLAGFISLLSENNGIWLMILFQFVVSILTILFVYLTLVQVISNKKALFATFIYSILIDPIIYTFIITTETLFTFLIVFSLYQLIIYIKENKVSNLITSGFMLGLSILTRPISEFLPLVLFVALLVISLWKKQKGFVKPIMMLATVLLVISPWLLRNYLVFGRADISTISGANLYFYNYAYLEAYLQNKPIDEIQSELRNQEIDETDMPVRSDFARSSKQASFAVKEILAHPITYAIVHLKGTVPIILGTSSQEFYHQFGLTFYARNIFDIVSHSTFKDFIKKLRIYISEKWLQVINLIVKGLIFLGALFGSIIGLWNKTTRYEILLLSLCGLYLIVLAGPQPFPRFGLPVLPFICILAGVGVMKPKTIIEKIRLHVKQY
jgi:4-amino-4-deoxy-L-arabinose transferase-like glycosyltransferase